MQKILKLLFALSTVATLPISVVACKQQDLDSTLKIINDSTNTEYNISDISDIPLEPNPITGDTGKTLTVDQSDSLAKTIAEKILVDTPIVWFDSSLAVDTSCYNINIANGTKENSNITWEVNGVDQRISINVEYFVGKVKQDKTFEAKQRITKTFNIKVAVTNSDNIVNAWVSDFNSKFPNSIDVNLSSENLTIPTTGGWSDLKIEVITVVYNSIAAQLASANVSSTVSTWVVEGNGSTITDGQLGVKIAASLNDAKSNTKDFMIKFV